MPKGIKGFQKGHKLFPGGKLFSRGRRYSPNTEFKKGQIPWNKGLHMWKDRTHPRSMLGKISPNKGKHLWANRPHPKGMLGKTAWNKGKKRPKFSKEWVEKMSESRILSPNRVFKNTSIELKVQNLLKESGIEFETNYPILGRPDIFIKPNICIFADGCYWHKCPECGFEGEEKREKDQRITRKLQSQGYTIIRMWEHDIKNNQFGQLNQLTN